MAIGALTRLAAHLAVRHHPQRRQVEEAMRRIGEQHRHVLVETYYRGRPYAEVAADLGIPEGTVKSRVYYDAARRPGELWRLAIAAT